MQIKTADGMANVSSAGVGGTALGLGAGALGLAVLQGANSGNGLLGGLFGGNSNQTNALMAEVSKLQAEKYSDKSISDVYNALFSQYKELAKETTDIDKRVSALEVAGPLREQLLEQKITCCCNASNTAIAALQATVANITKTIVPNTAICPGWGNVTITPATTTAA